MIQYLKKLNSHNSVSGLAYTKNERIAEQCHSLTPPGVCIRKFPHGNFMIKLKDYTKLKLYPHHPLHLPTTYNISLKISYLIKRVVLIP